jgi:hypothetical protein
MNITTTRPDGTLAHDSVTLELYQNKFIVATELARKHADLTVDQILQGLDHYFPEPRPTPWYCQNFIFDSALYARPEGLRFDKGATYVRHTMPEHQTPREFDLLITQFVAGNETLRTAVDKATKVQRLECTTIALQYASSVRRDMMCHQLTIATTIPYTAKVATVIGALLILSSTVSLLALACRSSEPQHLQSSKTSKNGKNGKDSKNSKDGSPSQPNCLSTNRNLFIDGLRGIAMLGVCFSHFFYFVPHAWGAVHLPALDMMVS